MRPLLLVRHGQSTWNLEHRYQGRADPPLSPAGRTGASLLAERLRPILCDSDTSLVASPLRRARETAEIIGARVAVEPRVDERFVERHVGPWQGLTVDEIDARWPGDRAAWRWPEGSETRAEVVRRVRPALRQLATQGDGAVVVTHAGVIRSLLSLVPGADRSIPNLGGSWFSVSGAATITPGAGFVAEAADGEAGDAVQAL